MADYRRFTKVDWYGWAGATKFPNGSQPFIYDRKFPDNTEMTIIADATGMGIYLYEDDEEPLSFYKDKPWCSVIAKGEIRHVIEYLSSYNDAAGISFELQHPQDDSVKDFYLY